MAQHDDGAAAVAVDDVDTTAPDNGQAVEQTETPENTDAADFYEDDAPSQEDGEDFDEDQADGEAEEPIAAPVSLKAEEKDKFSQLPREAQQALSEILQRRDTEVQQGLETARSAQRQAEAAAADQIAVTKRDFAEQSARLIAAFAPQPPSIDLLQQDPNQYHYLKAVYDQEIGDYQGMLQNLGGLHTEASGHFEAREQEAKVERIRGMMSIPEFASEETRQQFIGDLEKFGTADLGYSVEQLAQMDVTDMTALKRAMSWKSDAEKWRAHQKRRNERPREAKGRFTAAPVGARGAAQSGQTSTLKALYPND